VATYNAVAPPTPVADTRPNRPYKRLADYRHFFRTGDPSVPRDYGAGWLVLRGREHVRAGPRLVYRDGRFRVYHLSP
jgi:hypothetical protein